MPITPVFEAREARAVLGEHNAPASWYFWGIEKLLNDDGSDYRPPQEGVTQKMSAEEAAAFFGQASVDQVSALNANSAVIADLRAQIADRDGRIAALNAKLEVAQNAARLVSQADRSWDDAVRPAVAAVLES